MKLKALKPALSALPPVLGYAPGDTKAADRQRNTINPARAWYRTERWKKLRMQAFLRDGFICQRTGELLVGKYPAPNSPVANHKVPHRGDPKLFWDLGNLETVAKSVHDSLIQAEEQAMPTGFWD